MREIDALRNVIAELFSFEYKAYELEGICNLYGIVPEAGVDPMKSKRIYVLRGLTKLQDEKIWEIARKIAKEFTEDGVIQSLEPFLGDSELEI